MEEDDTARSAASANPSWRRGCIEVPALTARREAEPGEARFERTTTLLEPRITTERVEAGERHEAVGMIGDEPGEEVVLGLGLLELLRRALEIGKRVGEHRELDPGLGLPSR